MGCANSAPESGMRLPDAILARLSPLVFSAILPAAGSGTDGSERAVPVADQPTARPPPAALSKQFSIIMRPQDEVLAMVASNTHDGSPDSHLGRCGKPVSLFWLL